MLRGEANATDMLELTLLGLALLPGVEPVADHLTRRGVRGTVTSLRHGFALATALPFLAASSLDLFRRRLRFLTSPRRHWSLGI